MNNNIIKLIKSKYNIDLTKPIDFTNDMFIGIIYQSIFKQYLIQTSQFIENDIDRFYISYNKDKNELTLNFDSNYITDFKEHIQITNLGSFTIAKKSLSNNEYIWEIYINDRFDNIIEVVQFKSNTFIYKYLDAITEYCSEVGNKIML